MKEEDVYLKALGVLDDSLNGKNVSPVAIQTATTMLMLLWSSIYQERLKKEELKDAIRDIWEETLEEKKRNE